MSGSSGFSNYSRCAAPIIVKEFMALIPIFKIPSLFLKQNNGSSLLQLLRLYYSPSEKKREPHFPTVLFVHPRLPENFLELMLERTTSCEFGSSEYIAVNLKTQKKHPFSCKEQELAKDYMQKGQNNATITSMPCDCEK